MKQYDLSNVKTNEVSLVDSGAIKKKFIIYKNKNSKLNIGGNRSMTLEELKKLGLIDDEEINKLSKTDKSAEEIETSLIQRLVESVKKVLSSEKVEKDSDGKDGDDKNKEGDEKADVAKTKEDIKKLQDKIDELTKLLDESKKSQDLLQKISESKDLKEFAQYLKKSKELFKKTENPDKDTMIVKSLEGIIQRLEKVELKSNGIDGNEDIQKNKSSKWGGAFL